MPGIYGPRHPERTILYWVLFYYFHFFLREYKSRFEKHYGLLQPIIKEVVEHYLDSTTSAAALPASVVLTAGRSGC